MNGIDLLVEEHKNISAFTQYLSEMCCGILDGAEIDVNELYECIAFIRNYADKHHHGKEEKILFRLMLEQKHPTTEKLVRNGMLVEHDLGRYHIGELSKALKQYEESPTTKGKLDIITHVTGYIDLLKRHIEKEDSVCYPYALRILSEENKQQLEEEIKSYEAGAQQNHVQEQYLTWINNRKPACKQAY